MEAVEADAVEHLPSLHRVDQQSDAEQAHAAQRIELAGKRLDIVASGIDHDRIDLGHELDRRRFRGVAPKRERGQLGPKQETLAHVDVCGVPSSDLLDAEIEEGVDDQLGAGDRGIARTLERSPSQQMVGV